MSISLSKNQQRSLHTALQKKGFRSTSQRTSVYSVILSKTDHPTAEDILIRVRKNLPSISLATVYNCLEILVECGLVKQVNFDRASSRFCPNLTPHAHFKCNETGNIYDISLDQKSLDLLHSFLPEGYTAENFELSFLGNKSTIKD